jgi:hypothetical protein
VTKVHKVTACQGVFKRSFSVMETYAINGILNMGVEKKSLTINKRTFLKIIVLGNYSIINNFDYLINTKSMVTCHNTLLCCR